jgi:hypothetical protein
MPAETIGWEKHEIPDIFGWRMSHAELRHCMDDIILFDHRHLADLASGRSINRTPDFVDHLAVVVWEGEPVSVRILGTAELTLGRHPSTGERRERRFDRLSGTRVKGRGEK